jgi:hypothetical protein
VKRRKGLIVLKYQHDEPYAQPHGDEHEQEPEHHGDWFYFYGLVQLCND